MTSADRLAASHAEDRQRALVRVDLQLRRLREAISRAAVACMSGEFNAQQRVTDALQAVDHVRAALREIAETA